MSRRITLSILSTVLAMLIAGGAVAYLATRAVLLAELDDALVAHAVDRPELLPSRWRASSPTAMPEGERFVITSGVEGRKIRSAGNRPGEPEPRLLTAVFSTSPAGLRQRTVSVAAFSRPVEPDEAPQPVTVTYTGSAEVFHRALDRLALTLAVCVLAGGALAALIASRVSRAALKPLRKTADVIGTIDERKLDRRIDPADLPPELLPVAARLNDMLARLQEAFVQRRRFLADASHELRTPVAALVTGIEVTLARPRQADAYRACLESALADATHLRRLTERLMQQVRSETFDHDEPARPVDVSAMLNDCADIAAALAEARQVTIVRAYEPGIRVTTQPGRLRSIVQNLAGNAVYYNKPGGTVTLSASPESGSLKITVADTGAGIPPELIPRLFEPFFRGDSAHQHDAEGHLGLGLYLVQSHARALDGECTVESKIGVGTSFTVRLPTSGEQEREISKVRVPTLKPSKPHAAAAGR